MKKLIQPASFILYLLSFVFFFLLGMLYAKVSGAAEGQGLAGGAIVFMNGVIFSIIALVGSLIIAYKVSKKTVISINWALLILTVIMLLYLRSDYMERKQDQSTSMLVKKSTLTLDVLKYSW